jgi:hypothetical protein
MSFRLDQLLNASTIRISVTGKTYDGMGFFFAPGLALTSAEVVRSDEGEMVQVYLQGEKHAIPAEVKYRFPDAVGLVILQVQTAEAMPCAYLDADIKPGDQGYTFGCTATSSKARRVMVECEGLMGGSIGITHMAGRNGNLKLNGAPILNQRTGKVCGIVHSSGKGFKGDAVPMGIVFSEFPALGILQKEYHCNDSRWITLLHPDLEAIAGDWSYFDKGWMRREQSIKSLMFLLKVASQWAIIGVRMRHIFPWQSLIALIKATFRGNLGQELQRQYEYITRQLVLNVDPHDTNQARLLHRLDAQSWVVTQLMDMLITPEQDYASTSRLMWMIEIMQEQRIYIQTLKRMPGNFYPNMETFKRQWKLLEYDDKYVDTSCVLSGLVSRNTDTDFALWYTLKFFLNEFVGEVAKNSRFNAHISERLFSILAGNLKRALPAGESSVEDLLRDLDEEVRRHPELKVLQKVQILMHSVSGELVQGGQYRSWKGSTTYHFSEKCKLYPERAQTSELPRIICYDTREAAEQRHKPCKNCMVAEKMLNRRLSDWTESEAVEAVEAIGAVEAVEAVEAIAPIETVEAISLTEISISNTFELEVVSAISEAVDAPIQNGIEQEILVSQEVVITETVITETVITDAVITDAVITETEIISVALPIEHAPVQVDQLPDQAIEPVLVIEPVVEPVVEMKPAKPKATRKPKAVPIESLPIAVEEEEESLMVAVDVTPAWAITEAETVAVEEEEPAFDRMGFLQAFAAASKTGTKRKAAVKKVVVEPEPIVAEVAVVETVVAETVVAETVIAETVMAEVVDLAQAKRTRNRRSKTVAKQVNDPAIATVSVIPDVIAPATTDRMADWVGTEVRSDDNEVSSESATKTKATRSKSSKAKAIESQP